MTKRKGYRDLEMAGALVPKILGLGLSEIFDLFQCGCGEGGFMRTKRQLLEIRDINDNSPGFLTQEIILKYQNRKNDYFSLKFKDKKNGNGCSGIGVRESIRPGKACCPSPAVDSTGWRNPSHIGTCKITVTVLDINDNFPVFSENEYKVSLRKNSTKGTFIIKLTATDADDGPHMEKLNILLHPELRTLFVNIDINDNPPEIVLTSKPSPVREDAPSGTVVALISARDLDSGDNGKVTLHLPKSSPFTLKPSFSNNYELVTSGTLDREKFSEYNVEIIATDSGSPRLSSRKTIPVSITDVNDNPPMFTQPSYNVYLKENGVPGSILYSVSASDLDFGENAKISYSILDSKVQDVSVSSYVYINSDNGSIYSMHSFDYEKLKVFQIQVQAKDQGSPSLSSNATVHVFILDQNDNAPAVIYPSSAALGSLSHQRMPRSAKAGHLVTKVTAVDADSGHNAWISYKVSEATDASLFTVNLYTGEVRTKRAVSEQDDSSQRLLIEIKDDGEPVQSATVTVSILLEDGLHEGAAGAAAVANPNRNLQIQLNTDGPIKYVEVLGGDMLSQSQSFRSCMSPMFRVQ
uniref:Protocadherin 1 gamma 31 n=1 Tax=Amphiprion percula TaxID=161767 RepID=A0A3P8T425_AMPPE